MRMTAGQQHRAAVAARSFERRTTPDPFFAATKCARCGGPLTSRTMSWFTTEAICTAVCSKKEQEIKTALRAKGIDDAMEGCGYVPDV